MAQESALSDFHKMNLKNKNQVLVPTEVLKHLAASNSKSSKHLNIEDNFTKLCYLCQISMLLSKKCIAANRQGFFKKELRKTQMKRACVLDFCF